VLLADPPRTAYDFEFEIFGFPVRVSPFFWLVSGVLGHQNAVGLDDAYAESSPGVATLLLIWIAAVFISILIHELGHAFTMRWFGTSASIVLYYMGGLAIPDAGASFLRSMRKSHGGEQIAISFAGPVAQLVLAALLILGVRLSGYQLNFYIWPIDLIAPPSPGRPLPSVGLEAFIFFLIYPSIMWALLNLLPIFPLDGGMISREICTMWFGPQGFYNSLMLSLVTAGGVALYFFSTESPFNAMLFISLAVSNYQLLQTMRFGGGPW
jgi:stage IV sporulation protein FB